MNKINFLAKDSFPISTNTYDELQKMIHLNSHFAHLGGANYILSGCEGSTDRASVNKGVIVVNGEILPFEGGVIAEKVAIRVIKEADHAFGVDYPEAYIHRTAIFAKEGEYDWADFTQVLSNKELQNRIDKVSGDVIGTVKEWAGSTASIPREYMLCDGRDMLISDYPDLFNIINASFGGNGATTFKLPNCKGRVVVGYDNDNEDYNEIGKTGGKAKVQLTEGELPEHKHIVPWGENLNTAWRPDWGYPDEYFNNNRGYKAETDNDNTWPFTSPIGGNKEHENRQPYIVFAKIIKVR